MDPTSPNHAGLLAGASLAIVLVSYVALNLIWPFKQTEVHLAPGLNVDSVYSGSVAQAPRLLTVTKAIANQAAPAAATAPARPVATPPAPTPQVAMAPARPAKPAPEPPAPRRAAAVSQATQAPNPGAARTAKPAASTQWWPRTITPGRLNLLYAGQASNERTAVLLFDTALNAKSASTAGVLLLGAQGTGVKGSWALSSNGRMLMFRGLSPGRYSVVLPQNLGAANGLQLGRQLHGPIQIR